MTEESGGGDPPGLPRRAPRSFLVHWLVDSAVVFLAAVVVALFFGVDLVLLAVIAAFAGLPLAPLTRYAEERALATRPDAGGSEPRR